MKKTYGLCPEKKSSSCLLETYPKVVHDLFLEENYLPAPFSRNEKKISLPSAKYGLFSTLENQEIAKEEKNRALVETRWVLRKNKNPFLEAGLGVIFSLLYQSPPFTG